MHGTETTPGYDYYFSCVDHFFIDLALFGAVCIYTLPSNMEPKTNDIKSSNK